MLVLNAFVFAQIEGRVQSKNTVGPFEEFVPAEVVWYTSKLKRNVYMKNNSIYLMKAKAGLWKAGEIVCTIPNQAHRFPDSSAICWKNCLSSPWLFVVRNPVRPCARHSCASSYGPRLPHVHQTFGSEALLATHSFWFAAGLAYLRNLGLRC